MRFTFVFLALIAILLGGSVALLGGSVARAQPMDKKACLSSFEKGQTLRKDGDLLAAKEELSRCSQAACPDVVSNKCVGWVDELDKEIPSLVFVFPGGVDPSELEIAVDGVIRNEPGGGNPIAVNPGKHTISYRFLSKGEDTTTKTVVVALGEVRKAIELQAPTPTPVPAPEPTVQPPSKERAEEEGGISPLVWVGVGLAGAGLVVGGVTGGLALGKASDLDEVCDDQNLCPSDAESTRDDGELLAHVSTAGFAVAGVGAVLAVVGLFLPAGPEEDTGESSAQLLVGPGFIGARGRF
ncbi:MAG: hypothetical protein AAGA56_25375 [Myxococcota bacterium]